MYASFKFTVDNNYMLIVLLRLHVGVSSFQFPEIWQVSEMDPNREYPSEHEKVALVSMAYPPFDAIESL